MDEISGGNELNVRNIIDACKSGNFSTVRDFLDKDPSLSNCNWGYFTPLHFAVREGIRIL